MLEQIFTETPAFIPYLMAGDPDLETTHLLIRALTKAGAAAIELGIPYSDPLADGPTIAAAGMRALSNGTTLDDVLEAVHSCRDAAPVVLFTYYNPVYQYGLDRFAAAAAKAGAAGAIVPDLSLEESDDLRNALVREGLAMPLLVAPSTSRERGARIADASSGFVYLVSRLGVTGSGRGPDFTALRKQIATVRDVTEKPLAVGFGISTREHIDAVRNLVDGVIVGSAIIEAYGDTKGEEAAHRVERLARRLFS
jgi:tryptophan synthase alpha chain